MSPFWLVVILAIVFSTIAIIYMIKTDPKEKVEVGQTPVEKLAFIVVRILVWVVSDLLFLIPAALVVLFAMLVVTAFAPTHHDEWETSNLSLISLQDQTGTQGSIGGFLFISGEVNQATYYSYWYKDGNGFRHGQLTDRDNVVVYEDATDNPRLITIQKWDRSCEGWSWADYTFCNGRNTAFRDGQTTVKEFHVPPGTVIRKISLN